MKKSIFNKITIGIAGLALMSIIGVKCHQVQKINQMKANYNYQYSDDTTLENILDNSDDFSLQRKFLSFFGKKYYIVVEDVVVGEVTGKFISAFGDKLDLTDAKGNVVRSETQIKRFGPTEGSLFNISINRLAKIKDSNDSTIGYIGEEKLKDLFSFRTILHFYDSEKTELGKAYPSFFTFSKDHKVFDTSDNIDYTIDGRVFSLKSNISKVDNDTLIDEEDVIFYTIISDSIHREKSNSSDTTDK